MKIDVINNISFKNNNTAGSVKCSSDPQPLADNQRYPSIPTDKLSNAYIGYNLIDKYLGYRKISETKLPYIDNPAISYQATNGDKYIIIQQGGMCSVSTKIKTPHGLETLAVKHITEHLLFGDNSNHSYIKELNDLNIKFDGNCNENETNFSFWGNLDKKDFKKLFQIMSNMLDKKVFTQDEISKEKKILLSEEAVKPHKTIKQYVAKNIIKSFTEQNNQTSKQEVKYKDSVENLTINDVENYYNKYYKNQSRTTVIVSPFSPDEVMREVSKYIDKKSIKNEFIDVANNITNQSKEINLNSKDSDYSFAGFSFLIPSTLSDLNSYLISDFIKTYINDKKYLKDTYEVEPSFDIINQKINKDFNALSIFYHSENKDREIIKEKISSLISNLANKPNLKQEFENYKLYQKDTLSKIAEHNHDISNALLEDNFFSNEALSKCNSLNVNDVKNYINKYLDINKAYKITSKEKSENNISFGSNNGYETLLYPNNLLMSLKTENNAKRASYGVELTTKTNLDKSPVLAKLLKKMIEKAIQKDGLNIEIKANLQALYLSMDCLTDRAAEGIKKTNDFLYRFKFTPEEFEKAKKDMVSDIIKSGILSPKQDYEKLIYEINPNFKTYEEELADLKKITIDDLKNFYSNFLNKSQAIASLNINKKYFGDNKSDIYNIIGNNNVNFKPYEKIDWGEKFKVPQFEKNHFILNYSDPKTSLIQRAYRFPNSENLDDYVAFFAVEELLKRKLFKKVRTDKQLSYKIDANGLSESKYNNIKGIEIYTEIENDVQNNNLKKLYDYITETIEEFKENPGNQAELDKIKADLRLLHSPDLQSKLKMVNGFIQLESPYKHTHFQAFENAINNLDIEKVKNAAKYILNANSVTQIYSTKENIDKIRPLLNGEIHENK